MRVTQAYDGKTICEIQLDDEASLEQKLLRADRFFRNRSNWLERYRRIEILKRLARLVERDSDAFSLLIAREGGKPLVDSRVEVARAISGIEGAASALEGLAGTEIPMGLSQASTDRLAFTTLEPIGIVAAISAFNHPLNLIVHQVVPAIATGCPVIVKPANTTPLCCLRLIDLIREAGLPEPLCEAFVVEDLSLAERFATDGRIALLSFIGSAKVGWHLRSRVAAGTRVALEHGGAAPVIIDRSADLDAIVAPLVKGGFYHAGQVCVSVQRIYIRDELKEQFAELYADRARSLRVGDPSSAETDVGPLILPREVVRVGEWVSEAEAGGGHVIAGGKRISDRLYEPTVLLEPPPTARVSREEIFGPVVCIYGYASLSEAVDRANGLPYAFQASIFGRDVDVAFGVASRLDASAVMINDHTAFRTDWMPFAGRRQSGYGTGGIPYTMRDMTQQKMIVVKFNHLAG